jgi:isocitrate/isopropylmalate dehydrogenase
MLVSHLGDTSGAARIEEAIRLTAEAGIITRDNGGTATTAEAGAAIIAALTRLLD